MLHKLILIKGEEQQLQEYEDIEQAFNAAMPWIMKGYVARVTDKQGVVKYTQSLSNGQIGTYSGDATVLQSGPSLHIASGPARKPWWRIW